MRVDYKTAVTLKEKGYRERCDRYYNHKGTLTKGVSNNLSSSYCSAPTLSEVCDWLRSKGLHVYCEFWHLENKWHYNIQHLRDNGDTSYSDEGFRDHDAALLAGIKKALTLIEKI